MEYFLKKYPMNVRNFDRHWKSANDFFTVEQKKLEEKKLAVATREEKKKVKFGVKSKIQRILILQEQVEKALGILENGKFSEIRLIRGEGKSFERNLYPTEITALQASIRALQSEISKMEGDYAPQKVETTGDNVNYFVGTMEAIMNKPKEIEKEEENKASEPHEKT